MIDHLKTKTPPRNGGKFLGWPALGLVLVSAYGILLLRLVGQQPMPNQINNQPSHTPFEGMADRDPMFAARQLRALNVERQKSMVSDTDKLVKLAQELKSEVETGNSSALTVEQLRKIADIEKLARNVKQKMSISYAGGPTFDEPAPRQMH